MNKEQFLNSGLLEQYVLGLTSPEEDQTVQQFLQKYPELTDEVNALHQAMERYAIQHSIPPPKSQNSVTDLPKATLPSRAASGLNWSLIVALLLAATSFYFFRNNQQQRQNIHKIEAEYAALETYCQKNQSKVQAQQIILEKVQHPQTTSIVLNGTALAPNHFAVAHWNPKLQEGWLEPTQLPKLPAGKQYQIWADVEGEMISIGLIPPNSQELVTIEYIANAESINITEEQLGGTDHPTVSLLTANGLF